MLGVFNNEKKELIAAGLAILEEAVQLCFGCKIKRCKILLRRSELDHLVFFSTLFFEA
jgi:hypothetical protein